VDVWKYAWLYVESDNARLQNDKLSACALIYVAYHFLRA